MIRFDDFLVFMEKKIQEDAAKQEDELKEATKR